MSAQKLRNAPYATMEILLCSVSSLPCSEMCEHASCLRCPIFRELERLDLAVLLKLQMPGLLHLKYVFFIDLST